MMAHHNPNAKMFKQFGERVRSDEAPLLCMNIIVYLMDDRRRYNTSTANDVAAILPKDGSASTEDYDIFAQYHTGRSQKVSSLHLNYVPMSYPILSPFGSDGFRLGTHLFGHQFGKPVSGTVTQMDVYSIDYTYWITTEVNMSSEPGVISQNESWICMSQWSVHDSIFKQGGAV
jgi:hypothetical protein